MVQTGRARGGVTVRRSSSTLDAPPSAKALRLEFITRKRADAFILQNHYSGRIINNSQVHIGVFYKARLVGAMQFGPSIFNARSMKIVKGTGPGEHLEFGRMALLDCCPRNSESRTISIAMKMLQRQYPLLKWVISYADATQCGDGTIYRAAGFLLIGIQKNQSIFETASGEVLHAIALHHKKIYTKEQYAQIGAKRKRGYQLAYIKLFDPALRDKITRPVLDYDEILKAGAGMYKGKPRGDAQWVANENIPEYEARGFECGREKQGYTFMVRAPAEGSSDQEGKGGSNPTRTLQPAKKKRKKAVRKK